MFYFIMSQFRWACASKRKRCWWPQGISRCFNHSASPRAQTDPKEKRQCKDNSRNDHKPRENIHQVEREGAHFHLLPDQCNQDSKNYRNQERYRLYLGPKVFQLLCGNARPPIWILEISFGEYIMNSYSRYSFKVIFIFSQYVAYVVCSHCFSY